MNAPEQSAPGRLDDFRKYRVAARWEGAFNAGRYFKANKKDLPPEPISLKELDEHPLRDQFRAAQVLHLAEHEQRQTFKEVNYSNAKGQKILGCMWVFKYKLNKHGDLQKCKARLVVCGNQQAAGDLPTRATTLASATFRTLMAMTAKFDLETHQLDAVNAFVNCDLDEVVYMRPPPGFTRPGKVLLLQKALYGLRRSPLLWQNRLTEALGSLGFTAIPQEPCVAVRGGVVVFYYVDDIVLVYRKQDKPTADMAIEGLKKQFEMTDCGEVRWFLGIHVVRDRQRKQLWLS